MIIKLGNTALTKGGMLLGDFAQPTPPEPDVITLFSSPTEYKFGLDAGGKGSIDRDYSLDLTSRRYIVISFMHSQSVSGKFGASDMTLIFNNSAASGNGSSSISPNVWRFRYHSWAGKYQSVRVTGDTASSAATWTWNSAITTAGRWAGDLEFLYYNTLYDWNTYYKHALLIDQDVGIAQFFLAGVLQGGGNLVTGGIFNKVIQVNELDFCECYKDMTVYATDSYNRALDLATAS